MSLYRAAVRPLLFQLDPERAHEMIVSGLELSAKAGSVRKMIGSALRVRDERLSAGFAGVGVDNPVGLAAGFDKDCRLTKALPALGFGFIELGTVTPRPQPGNPKPRIFRIPESEALLNRLGFNNQGAAAVAAALKAAGRCEVPVGINLGMNKDTPPEKAHLDYGEAFSTLRAYGDYFVVNVSSPNTGGLRALQERLKLERILTELRARNTDKTPIFVKLAPDIETEHLIDVIPLVTQEAAGLIISNTTIARDAVPARWATEPGGVSGAPVREKSTRLIAEAYRISGGRLPIIGVGGVFTAEDAWRKICAGASAVQVYTGMIYRGPGIVREINEGLLTIMDRQGVPHIREAVGRSHPEVSRKG